MFLDRRAGTQHKGIEVRILVRFAFDLLCHGQILAGRRVMKNGLHPPQRRPANVRAEHDGVFVGAAELLLAQPAGQHLDVAAAAIDLLPVLDGKLDDQLLPFVGHGVVHLRADGEKPGRVFRLETFVLLGTVYVVKAPADPCPAPLFLLGAGFGPARGNRRRHEQFNAIITTPARTIRCWVV